MEKTFVKVTEALAFNELAEQSKTKPIVIFKHSTTCSISAAAYREMSDYDGEVALVDVQRARDLSQEIENRTGIRHESPQVIVLRNGEVVWNASHFDINHDAVEEAVRRANSNTT